MKRILITLFGLATLSQLAAEPASEAVRDRHVEARLVSEVEGIQPGKAFRVGLLLNHDPGWHTYWKTSATGYPTSIEWELPPGFSAGPIQWPAPKIYPFMDWTEYVYDDEVLLVVTIKPPASIDVSSVDLKFSADWLMCENVCIPGGMSSSMRLPVVASPPEFSSQWKNTFAQHDEKVPKAPKDLELSAWSSGNSVILEVTGQNLPAGAVYFDAGGAIEPASGIQPSENTESMIRFRLLPTGDGHPDKLLGVLNVPGSGDQRFPVTASVDVGSAAPPAAPAQASLIGILSLAFIGGLILNLMPCVFPVLGIKIMGFVNQAGESRGKVVAHGLVFSLGVLLSFWLLAIVLLVLRSGGLQLGWGFQLQSPAFVLVLTLLLFAFGLNMSGLFEVGQSAVGVGSNLTARSGLTGSFFSGVLATVVATPCAAPFLAPALGAALALPAASSLLVFTFIAIGLALPYLLLSSFPSLIRWLPKPGPWMETFKQFMGFLLYATVAYLLWVLAGQLGESGFAFLKVLLSLVLLAMALWIFGRWGAYHRSRPTRIKAIAATLLVGCGALWAGLAGTTQGTAGGEGPAWQKWEPGLAASLAAEGKTVYVDFTARWCVTCQTNKATVFSSDRLRQLMEEQEVVLLKADWTNRDSRISEALAAYGRSAVPFNLVYGPSIDQPLVLPEILTPGIVTEAIHQAGGI